MVEKFGREIQDVTEHFDCLKAERKEHNTLILRKLDGLYAAFDGKRRRFELEYRWHPTAAAPLNAVQGNEFIFCSYKDIQGWKKKSLFDLFQLFA
jgi:hypothetical protein